MAKEKLQDASTQEYQQLVQSRYDLGKDLVRAGKFEEALKEYLWCFDEGMIKAEAFTGVRLSFLAGSLGDLMDQYPPTRAELETRRDAAAKTMWESPKNRRQTADFAVLNSLLKQNEDNLKAFEKLPKGDPRRMALDVYDALLARKAYEDALEAQPDQVFDRSFQRREAEARGEGFAKLHPELKEVSRKSLLQSVCKRIPALIAVGRQADAEKLRDRMLKLDDSEKTRSDLEKAFQPKSRN